MSGRGAADQAPYNWSGFYFGLNGGYGWGGAETNADFALTERTRVFRAYGKHSSISDVTVPLPSLSLGRAADLDGWIGGGQVGYNIQAKHFVFGIEADLQWSGKDGSGTACSTAACGPGSVFLTASHDQNWFGTLRARAGVLPDPRLLLYATGGLAYSSFDSDYTAGIIGGSSTTFSDDKKKGGWVIGGGAEWAIHCNMTLKAEYLYMDYGKIGGGAGSATDTVVLANTPQCLTTVIDTTADGSLSTRLTDQLFRIGLNYKFGEREHRPLK